MSCKYALGKFVIMQFGGVYSTCVRQILSLSYFSFLFFSCVCALSTASICFLTSDASNANFYGSSLWFLTNMYEGKSRSKGTFEKWYTYSNDRKLKHTLFFLHYLPALQRTLCNVSQVSWFRRKKKFFLVAPVTNFAQHHVFCVSSESSSPECFFQWSKRIKIAWSQVWTV